jgi:hypothetical protein
LTYRRTIVCLANSRKYSGRCIAGLELNGSQPGAWIRPVSSAPKGELQFEHLYHDGGEPQVLDVIEIEFLKPRPAFCHREDHVIEARTCWTRRGGLTPGVDYAFSVTDGSIEREFHDARLGTSRYLRCPLLCLSVSEVFESQNACYKLIAGVIA